MTIKCLVGFDNAIHDIFGKIDIMVYWYEESCDKYFCQPRWTELSSGTQSAPHLITVVSARLLGLLIQSAIKLCHPSIHPSIHSSMNNKFQHILRLDHPCEITLFSKAFAQKSQMSNFFLQAFP